MENKSFLSEMFDFLRTFPEWPIGLIIFVLGINFYFQQNYDLSLQFILGGAFIAGVIPRIRMLI